MVAVTAVLAVAPVSRAATAGRYWAWCSRDEQGTWQPGWGRWFTQNDAWNGGHGPQSICAHTATSWTAWSDQPAGNTAVETFPDSQEVFGTAAGLRRDPLSSYRQVTSSFSESMPRGRGVSAEFAYDTWWGNGWDTQTELMIWADTVNRSLDGSSYLGRAVIFGQVFWVYEYAGDATDPPEFVFRLNHNETSGTVHILASALWLERRGYMKPAEALTAVPAGFEICSTAGVTRAFTLHRMSVTTVGG